MVTFASLRSGHLGGFALDPLYEEPRRHDDELLAFDDVILTPHIAEFDAIKTTCLDPCATRGRLAMLETFP